MSRSSLEISVEEVFFGVNNDGILSDDLLGLLLEEEMEASAQGRQSNLERLQLDGTRFYQELQDCMESDLDALLRLAADRYSKKG